MYLDAILKDIKTPSSNPNLLVGLNQPDDAGVYKISESLALIQTVDFFTPVIDDPYWFGQIAVANALSDVYAMGGKPKTAMNLVAFPSKTLDIVVLKQIIKGGLDKMEEAGVTLLGGHSIEDKELKYGLSVTGFIHPDYILNKQGMKIGNKIVLTKALGTGIINKALKAGLVSKKTIKTATELMARLNETSASIIKKYPVNACTDVSGFGLVGHMAEMIENTGLSLEIESKKLPILDEVLNLSAMGFTTEGAQKNKLFRNHMVRIQNDLNDSLLNVMYDPQTSGGLIIAVAAESSEQMIDELNSKGIDNATIIGEVVKGSETELITIV